MFVKVSCLVSPRNGDAPLRLQGERADGLGGWELTPHPLHSLVCHLDVARAIWEWGPQLRDGLLPTGLEQVFVGRDSLLIRKD